MTHRLIFTTPNLRNTTIADASDVVYFDVQTPTWERHLTTVRRLDPGTGLYELTGRVRSGCRDGDGEVAVSLFGGAFEPAEGWVRTVTRTSGGRRPPGECRWQFDDGEGNEYLWRAVNGRGQLELYSAEHEIEDARPLATFYPHKRFLSVGLVSQQAYLDVDDSVVESIDAIIRRSLNMFGFEQHG